MESRSVSRAVKLAFAFGLVGAGIFFAGTARAQTIVDDWANIKVPPAPELKTVKVDTGSTALIVMDIVKQICTPRPRCVASLPRLQKVLGQAREKGMLVVHTLAGMPITDVLPEATPRAEEPHVSSGPDKFLNTNLDQILKDKGIKTVIMVGTSAEGAVLNTSAGAALRGIKVIVPVDGMSSINPFSELYTAFHLANAPRIGTQVTLTKFDLLGF